MDWLVSGLYGLIAFSFLMSYLSSRQNSLLPVILNRWARWLLFSSVTAYCANEFEWSDKPAWLLWVSAFLLWFIFETAYHWLLIKSLSKSDIPLLPKFKECSQSFQWPRDRQFVEIKAFLNGRGFMLSQALKTTVTEGISLKVAIFEDRAKTTRAQVLFVPKRNQYISAFISFFSENKDGEFFLTDNIGLPYGGFYPERWNVHRKPLVSSVQELLDIHERRINGKVLNIWKEDPAEQLNQQQKKLDLVNKHKGFFNPTRHWDDFGRISKEGCYRLWKEMWLLNYLGMSLAR